MECTKIKYGEHFVFPTNNVLPIKSEIYTEYTIPGAVANPSIN